jgi:predicted ATP-dependent endonuclease of OLD family
MTTRNLENITIHQFRGLKELELKDLGQINLLVGVNNSGKTSVLEALSIYCDPLDLRGWISTALQRENSFTTAQTSIFDLLQWLFTKEKTRTGTILISGDGRFAVKRLKAVYQEVESILLLKNTKTRIAKIEQQNYSIPESENTPEVVRRLNLKIELHASETNFLGTETYPFIRQYQLQENEPFLFQGDIDSRYTLLISTVTPTSHRSSVAQIRLLSEASFSDFKADALKLLNQMDQNISDIEILVPPDSVAFSADIYIQHKKLGLVPVSSFGDGVRRLLHIALKLASVKGGVLLIDELEATIHTEALQSSFQWLAKWSKEMNVQIFATTHSLEAIDSLLAVNNESLDLVLYRLEPQETQTKVVRHDWSRLKRQRENLGMEVR